MIFMKYTDQYLSNGVSYMGIQFIFPKLVKGPFASGLKGLKCWETLKLWFAKEEKHQRGDS